MVGKQADGYEGYLLLNGHDERAFLQGMVEVREVFGDNTPFRKNHHAPTPRQGPYGLVKGIGPAMAFLAVYLNVQFGKHVAKEGYLLYPVFSYKSKVIVHDYAHGCNVEVGEMIGAEHVGTPRLGCKAILYPESNPDDWKK